jgi:hypothetical protein
MKLLRSTITIAALALFASYGALAQNKAGQTSGEMSPQQKADEGVVKAGKPAPTTEDRKKLQAEAKAARKGGASAEGECGPEQKADVGGCKKPAVTSTKTRAEVKAEAVAATKTGKLSGGEMSQPQKVDEGVVKK